MINFQETRNALRRLIDRFVMRLTVRWATPKEIAETEVTSEEVEKAMVRFHKKMDELSGTCFDCGKRIKRDDDAMVCINCGGRNSRA